MFTFLRLLNVGISIFVSFYVIKIFDVEDYGMYTFIISSIGFVTILSQLNYQEYLINNYPLSTDVDRNKLEIGSIFPLIVSGLVFSLLFISFYNDFFERFDRIDLFILLCASNSLVVHFLRTSLLSRNNIRYAFWDLVTKNFWLTLILFTLIDLDSFLIGKVFFTLLSLVFLFISVANFENIKYVFDFSQFKNSIFFGFKTLIPYLSFFFIELFDKLILGYNGNLIDLGYFSFAILPASLIYVIFTSLIIALSIERLSYTFSNRFLTYKLINSKLIEFCFIGFFTGMIFLFLYNDIVIKIFDKPEFSESIAFYPHALFTYMLITLIILARRHYLFEGAHSVLNKAIYLGLLLKLFFSYLVVKTFGYSGIFYVSIVSYLVILYYLKGYFLDVYILTPAGKYTYTYIFFVFPILLIIKYYTNLDYWYALVLVLSLLLIPNIIFLRHFQKEIKNAARISKTA